MTNLALSSPSYLRAITNKPRIYNFSILGLAKRTKHFYLYTGNFLHISTTWFLIESIFLALPRSRTISQIQLVKISTSLLLKPLVVIAGVPSRMPEVTKGDWGSSGTAFLLAVIFAWPKACSQSLPVNSLLLKSI